MTVHIERQPRTRPFRPTRWLRNGHLQTIVPSLLRFPPRPARTRHRIELDDGDFLDVDVAAPEGPPRGYLLLVHGLEGSSRSPYVLGTQSTAIRRGLLAVALNQRGCSGEPNRLMRSYHSGVTDDIPAALAWIHARWPGLHGGVMGFSLGANQTVKVMGTLDGDLPDHLRAAIAVSPPFDLFAVQARLDGATGAMYRFHFLSTLVPKGLAKARRFPDVLDRRRILRSVLRLKDYDDAVTAPVHGFASADDYYDRSSCGRYLDGVKRPTLILTSLDDPIIPGASVPIADLEKHPAIDAHVTDLGGHVGFMAGPLQRPRFWAEHQAVRWLLRRL